MVLRVVFLSIAVYALLSTASPMDTISAERLGAHKSQVADLWQSNTKPQYFELSKLKAYHPGYKRVKDDKYGLIDTKPAEDVEYLKARNLLYQSLEQVRKSPSSIDDKLSTLQTTVDKICGFVSSIEISEVSSQGPIDEYIKDARIGWMRSFVSLFGVQLLLEVNSVDRLLTAVPKLLIVVNALWDELIITLEKIKTNQRVIDLTKIEILILVFQTQGERARQATQQLLDTVMETGLADSDAMATLTNVKESWWKMYESMSADIYITYNLGEL